MKGKQKITSIVPTGIYVRVSTEDQAQEGYSIRAQIEKLKAYAVLRDWYIYDIYSDEGISGKNIVERPAINRLIDDIEDGKVKNVLVFKVDRLTRSVKNLIELVDLFEDNNCKFNSLTESIDTDTPSGRMFLKIIGIFAEFERENLASRLKLGFERKAREGYSLANYISSYGYNKEKGQKIQEILPNEAKIVREIFSMFVDENYSMTRIAKTLNQRRIPTKTNAGSWDVTTIRQILKNPTYIGKVRYSTLDANRYFEADGHHEPILPNEVFNSAQEKLKNKPNISKTKQPNESNYFCGVLVCARCNSKFTTKNYYLKKTGESKCTYKCNKTSCYKNDDVTCKSPQISHDKVDTAFIKYINRIDDLSDIDNVKIEDDSMEKERELQEYIKDCEQKINSLLAQRKRINDQYISEEIAFEDYKNLMQSFNEKYEFLENELYRAEAEISTAEGTPNVQKEDIILSIKENWEYLNNKQRMMFLQDFTKNVIIKVENISPKHNVVEVEDIKFNTDIDVLEWSRQKLKKFRGREKKDSKEPKITLLRHIIRSLPSQEEQQPTKQPKKYTRSR